VIRVAGEGNKRKGTTAELRDTDGGERGKRRRDSQEGEPAWRSAGDRPGGKRSRWSGVGRRVKGAPRGGKGGGRQWPPRGSHGTRR